MKKEKNISLPKKTLLGIQMLFVAFGATVLVPLLIGIDPSVALFTAGLGTLIFHLITGGIVPIFLGSSFVFIVPIIAATQLYGYSGALSGLIAVGLVFIIVSLIIRKKGIVFIKKIFPPIVVGPVIMVIGLSLSSTAVEMSSHNWILASITLITAIIISIFGRRTIKLLPIIGSIIFTYIIAMIFGMVDYSSIISASWISLPNFITPTFSLGAILLIIPVAIAPMIEHVGDMYAISKATGKDFIKKPGIHKTMLGDGLTTIIAALFGGPPNTTYSEVTGAIVLTKLKDPMILRISAITAICFAFIGKISGFLQTIPDSILGGTLILLFGMITIVGIKSIVESTTNLNKTKNMIIAGVMLTIGVGGAVISSGTFSIEGVGLASIVGIVLNLVLPEKEII
ncbi:uracil permease [archaeon]|nr:uracil permease [archaeon]NCP79349.1 uracil permease [archaeon]NCP97292.1 uracil permease [archaeon]NCQ07116.1 uracil permease [archaeon]NCQ50912.1 uracil permease [archaeon]